MSITRLNQPIRGPNDEITTINKLDKRGLIEYRKVDDFHFGKYRIGVGYFAYFKGTTTGFEISETVYLNKRCD
jgi:hypothetical protein